MAAQFYSLPEQDFLFPDLSPLEGLEQFGIVNFDIAQGEQGLITPNNMVQNNLLPLRPSGVHEELDVSCWQHSPSPVLDLPFTIEYSGAGPNEEIRSAPQQSTSAITASAEKTLTGNSNQHKPRRKAAKPPGREPRIAIVIESKDVDDLPDGYKWRKHGQKAVKNSQYPRKYYRCTTKTCSVKKRSERSSEDPRMVVPTYLGQHNHYRHRDLFGAEIAYFVPSQTPASLIPALQMPPQLPMCSTCTELQQDTLLETLLHQL